MRLQGGHSPGWNVCSDRPYRTCPSLTTANALDRRLSHCIIRLACHIANRLGPSRTFRAAVHATSAHRQARVVASTSTDEAGEEPALGSAYQSTLQVLEWSRLCRHLASFAQTTLGQRACLSLIPPTDQAGSEALLSDTKAVQALEGEYAVEIEFGGIQTAQASDALRRASRGGMLSGQLLQAVASLIQGMSKLQKAIAVAARQAEATGHTVLEPVVQAFKDLPALPELSGEIGFALQEDGAVREAASDGVKKAAAKVRTVEGRLRGILKGHQGEITEIGGRMCVAVPSTADRPPRGILLGSAPGGSAWYLEPPAAVPLNNDLISARAELTAAEEAVLWRLTGKVSERAAELEAGLKAVVWLDTTAAKARCGRWTGGILPEFVPFPKTGKARGGSKKKATAAAAAKKAEGGEEEESVDDDLSTHFMYLRRLRHPLLLGDRLVAEAQGGWRGGSSASVAPKRQRLPGWRGNRNAPYDATSSSGEDSDAEMSPAALPPVPVPIDVTVASGTRAVIITGPNTGGKTATLKAVGLAVLMAKAGMPVPAADPVQMPCFDAVLADIGDEQSLSASLSTFSGHLRRIEALRKESSSKSLILLDELGTGTDPTEGAALGIALLRALARGGPGAAGLTVATTHHTALTALKYEENSGNSRDAQSTGPTFENVSMEFDESALQPTYRLLWGVPGRSNALNIAERLGLDGEVVEAARERLGVAAARMDEKIIELEELRKEHDANEAAVLAAESRAKELRAKAAILR